MLLDLVVDNAVNILKNGGIVALPTDTVYGIGCLVSHNKAIIKMYDIKGRHSEKPFAICVSIIEDIYKYASPPFDCKDLMRLLPGKCTLIFKRKDSLNKELNPNVESVAFRVTACSITQEIIKRCGEALVLTSANLSGEKSCVDTKSFYNIWDNLDMIVDSGDISSPEVPDSKLGSTIIDLTREGYFKIIRKGCNYPKYYEILSNELNLAETF